MASSGVARPLPPEFRAAMIGVSWHPGCPVSLDELALLELDHWGFDGQVHTGQLVVAAHVANPVSQVFAELFAAGFPIERMERVEIHGGDDDRSMDANNTHAFNCRPVAGTDRWSEHAFGTAIDLNPVQNPYVRDGRASPAAGGAYIDRADVRTGMIVRPGPVVEAFAAIGWRWGGDYGDVTALDRLNLSVHAGEVVGLLGAQGSGRTSALRIALGQIRPTGGRVQVFGFDPWTHPAEAYDGLAFVPEEFTVWPQLTGGQILELLGAAFGGYDPAYGHELVERFGLDTSQVGRRYARGSRQKIAVIAALMTRASLLVMDEPAQGLSRPAEVAFHESIREAKARGQAVLLTSRVLDGIESVCDRVAILRQGTVVEQGKPSDVLRAGARAVAADYGGQPPVRAIGARLQMVAPT